VLWSEGKGGGGVSVGGRVFGSVRWWKWRKGLGNGDGGGDAEVREGDSLHLVVGTLILKCDKYEMEQVFRKQPETSPSGDFPSSGGKGWGLGWR